MSTYRFTVQGDTIPAIEEAVQEELRRAYQDGHPGLAISMDVQPAREYRSGEGRTIDRQLVAEVTCTIRDIRRWG